MLGCGIATGWGAVWNTSKVEPGSSVAVFGLGAVGLAVVQAAAKAGAKHVVGIDLNSDKFELAQSFGASARPDPNANPNPDPKPSLDPIVDSNPNPHPHPTLTLTTMMTLALALTLGFTLTLTLAVSVAAMCINPSNCGHESIVKALLASFQWGIDYTFDCTGNTKVMRDALEAAHRGWGVSCVIGAPPSTRALN